MFADVAGSTSLYDKLGNTEAEKQIALCVALMSDITANYSGVVIKTIGDEIMASFDTAEQSANAAVEMQKKISGNNENPLSIRIGLQYGDVIEKDNDIFGDAVNVAARMAGIAQSLQIITTEEFTNQLTKDFDTRLFDKASVKGKDAELHIHQINWEEESNVTQFATSYTSELNKLTASNKSIELSFSGNDKLFTSTELKAGISIGRDAGCTIAIDTQFASRSHFNLEFRRDKFVVVDHSTNGTYIQLNDQDEVFIRREEFILSGEGKINMGESFSQNSNNKISFRILQTS